MTKLAAIFALASIVASCVAATEIRNFDRRPPLPANRAVRSIAVSKIVGRFAAGQEVGTVQMGWACAGQDKVFWKSGAGTRVSEEGLAEIVMRELQSAGYPVAGNPDSLFEDPQQRNVDFFIGGIVKRVAMNICYPSAFGSTAQSSGEASIEVEWQVFDRRSRSVVFTLTTGGAAKKETADQGGYQAYWDAFALAVRNLLAEQRFAALITRP